MKKVTISITIPLADDMLADAVTIAAIKEPVEAFHAALGALGHNEPTIWTQDTQAPPAPVRAPRSRRRSKAEIEADAKALNAVLNAPPIAEAAE